MKLFKPKTLHMHIVIYLAEFMILHKQEQKQNLFLMLQKISRIRRCQFQARCVTIKEERAEEVKHHLWVLWTDYFKPEHLEKYPNLHDLFWNATKKAGEAKKTEDPAVGEELLALIDEIDKIFVDSKS